MTELINSLKTLAYGGGGGSQSIADRRSSTGQLRIIPLLNLGRNDSSNDSSFTQWRDAMRMVARLPGGLPPEFRLRLWENLSDRYMQDHGISWGRVMAKCRLTNSRDVEIADQIEKDLHRTGCTGFEKGKQVMLKRVLVSYSRWNPSVGYCQGFNMIGAMLLQMTSGDETLTLKVLIFLIEGILPQGYFSQGLRGLAVDMAVFREILRLRKPTLHNHLSVLQNGDENPPLTDVFTMHWFLTLFIHCLPTNSVLRIWDLVFLEGSEVLLRTALVLWTAIEPRILAVNSADEFYSVMGVVTREMLEFGLMDPNALVKCIVSVGPFPFPGLAELRQQQRAIIQQDTPYKSFFLAKRELDNLKRHYAAMKDRQKATTIILKGLEASRVRVPGQRSNSLFVPPTMKKQTLISQKPSKLRRASSGGKGGNNINSANINNGNLNNRQGSTGTGKTSSKQITMTWDKAAPKIRSKNFRRRRTASTSSGHTTDSSSSTELCDSNSSMDDSSDSEGVWSETDNRWKKPKSKRKSDSPGSISLKSNKSNLSLCPPPKEGEEDQLSQIDNLTVTTTAIGGGLECTDNVRRNIVDDDDKSSLPPLETPGGSDEKSPGGSEEQPSSEESAPNSGGQIDGDGSSDRPKILDTNDSQHFLEEISRLGKSDSFYENLSKRICELQFQNLKILNSCNTTIDPKSLMLPEFEKSPLPSPINPKSPRTFSTELLNGSQNDDMFLQDSSMKLTPVPTPKNFLSPRGSFSSISECQGMASPLKSPASPTVNMSLSSLDSSQHVPKSRRSSYSKRNSSAKSSQSISSMDIPDICVDAPVTGSATTSTTLTDLHRESFSLNGNLSSSEDLNDSISNYANTLRKNPVDDNYSRETTDFDEDVKDYHPIISKRQGSPRRSADLTLDLSACHALNSLKGPIKPFTPLKTPDFLQFNSLTHNKALELNDDEIVTGSPKSKADVKSCLVSPILSPDLTETALKKSPSRSPSKDISIPPRPKNFPVSPAQKEEFLLAYTGENGEGIGLDMGDSDEIEIIEKRRSCCGMLEDDDSGVIPAFPTTACPCQCQTTGEAELVNAVIRQNIAILQRLKLKPAYDAVIGGGGDDEYEDLEFDDGDASSCSDISNGFPDLSSFANGKEYDSSDRDSGLPTCSSKNSLSRKDSTQSKSSARRASSPLRHQDSSGCSSGGSSVAIASSNFSVSVVTTTPRRRNSSGGAGSVSGGGGGKPVRRKSLTRTSSGNSGGGQGGTAKPKKNFNPFPTTRRAKVRTTKFGLYN